MEIPAWVFFSFWPFVGLLSLLSGIETLKYTNLYTSLSPTIIFLVKLFLNTAACHSFTHALVFRTKMKIRPLTYYLWFAFAIFPIGFAGIILCEWCFPIYTLVNISLVLFFFLPWSERFVGPIFLPFQSIAVALLPLLNFLLSPHDAEGWYILIFISNFMVFFHLHFVAIDEQQFALIFHYLYMYTLFLLCGDSPFLTFSILFSSFFTLAISGNDERLQRWLLPLGESKLFSKVKEMMMMVIKKGKVIEFCIGMAGALLFQKFFPFTSSDHVVAFLCLAVAWLANLALLLCTCDLGIFNFLLGNVVVGCIRSEFGFGCTTWIVYGVALGLYVLRLKLELVSIVERGEEKASVVGWGESGRTEVGGLIASFSLV